MGDILTRAFVWIAILGYAVAFVLQVYRIRARLARVAWTLGAAAFVVQVLCAFHYFHGWSHAAAFAETARQTKGLTGFDTGSGLYLNYVFLVVWVVDAAWWWRTGDDGYAGRAGWISAMLHAFFVFMIVNGAIVFGKGPVRWYGAALIAMMVAAYAKGSRR